MPPPDYPTVTHREYGHRVGIFRLFELFDAHAIRATAAVDALTAQGYPRLVTECQRRGVLAAVLMSLGIDWLRSLTHQYLFVVGAITLLVVLLAPDGVGAVVRRRGSRAGAPQDARS
jgi:hypothetical protein